MDSNELKRRPGIKDNDTYRIDSKSGVVQQKGSFGWKDTETRIDPKSGVVQEQGVFGRHDTDTRIDPRRA